LRDSPPEPFRRLAQTGSSILIARHVPIITDFRAYGIINGKGDHHTFSIAAEFGPQDWLMNSNEIENTNRKIRALIVDDEQLARDELAFLLKEFPDIEITGQAGNGVEAVNLIRDLSPHLVFLDVQMPGADGFAVIRKLAEKKIPLPVFVFVTAYDQYAVQAFEVNALDYLVKPIARSRLERAILKSRRTIETEDSTREKIERLVDMLEKNRHGPQKTKLIVKTVGRLHLVDSSDVIYASIEDGVISIVTKEFEGQSNFRTVEELQANLDPNTFWRVHRSYLININRIKEVVPWFKSSFQLKMDDRKQTEIPVSRAQTRKLREILNL
jgi:two-component system response regulator LytT